MGREEEALLCDTHLRTWVVGERGLGGRRGVRKAGLPSPITDGWLLATSLTPAVHGPRKALRVPSHTQLRPPGEGP